MAKAAAPAPSAPAASSAPAPSPTASSVPLPAAPVHDAATSGPLADDAASQDRDAKAARLETAKSEAAAKEKRKADVLANVSAEATKRKLAQALGDAPPEVAKPGEAPKPKAQAPKPTGDISDVARLSSENRRLAAELAKFADKKPGESKADLIEAIKKDPGVVFREIDDPELLVKLAEARQKHLATLSPEAREIAELRLKTEAVEKELADAKAEKEQASAELTERSVYDATAKAIEEGVKDETGKVLFDHSGYTHIRAFTKAGELDGPRRVMLDATDRVKDLGRAPNADEMATILTIVSDKLEAKLRKTAEVARGVETPKPSPKTETKPGAKDRRPATLTSRIGGGGTVPVVPSNRTKADRKNAIFQRLQTAKLAERAQGQA
jgi:hypothetical protein